MKLLGQHYPEDTWMDRFPSEAATVEDPRILQALRDSKTKGVLGLWDFDMLDSLKERLVNATIDPSGLKRIP